MADETDKTVDRDGWRRLLAQGGGEPPELTDARIRAAARQAIPPRAARWWLPASLAASMLLAVLVVQWQYEARGPTAVMTESDVAVPAAPPAQGAREDSALIMQDISEPPPPPELALPAPEREYRAERSAAPAAASAPAPISVPESAAKERAADEGLNDLAVTGANFGGLLKSADAKRSPGDWYAEIEKLRAAGKQEEAERELEKLEAAHPGWLEEHLKQEQPRE